MKAGRRRKQWTEEIVTTLATVLPDHWIFWLLGLVLIGGLALFDLL
jgi:hypothetical protein